MSSQEQSPSETKEAVSISMQLMREQIGSGEEVQQKVGSGEVRRQLIVALS